MFIKTISKNPRIIAHRLYSIADEGGKWAEREKAFENAYFNKKNAEDLERLKYDLESRRRKYARRKLLEDEANKIRLECHKADDERAEGITEELCVAQKEMDQHSNLEELEKHDEEIINEEQAKEKLRQILQKKAREEE